MTTKTLTKVPRLHQLELRKLISLAAEGLVPMFDAERKLFCSRMVRTERGLIPKGISHRYTVIALLGLHHMQVSGLPGPVEIQSAIDALLRDTNWLDNIGDLGLLLWLCALASPNRLPDFCSRHALRSAVDRYSDGRERRTMELSWFLSGISHAAIARPEQRENLTCVAFATYLLLRDNHGPHGAFGHQARNGGLRGIPRSRIGTFADQVYPIYALAKFYQAFQCEEALQVSSNCADAICRAQGPLGQWWWHYEAESGKACGKYPVFSVHQHGMAPMALFALGVAAQRDFTREIYKGLEWIYGANELHADMRDSSARVIWRCIRPAKSSMYYAEALSLLKLSTNGRTPRNLNILYECWPYELGWLLYAFALLIGA